MTLEELRNKIDALDNQLLETLSKRMEVVREVGNLKRSNNAIIYRPEREKSIIDRLEAQNEGLLNRNALEAIFLEIFAVSRNLELPERVGYLGPEGSFTHQAAESRFGAMSDYVPLRSIRAVFDSIETGRVRFGVVPIENNQEGSVSETIDQLCIRDVKIVAEIPMAIHFAFASRIEKIKDIKVIYSKDIAFRQCKNFLWDYFGDAVKLEEVPSTSKAAELAMTSDSPSAAICSHIAAKSFGLPILFENIEDSQNNTTRFLILGKDIVNQKGSADKTSILAKTDHEPGALVDLLLDFKKEGINLTKIESRPAKIKDSFRYQFLIDFEGHIHDDNVQRLMHKYGDQITFLGSYLRLV